MFPPVPAMLPLGRKLCQAGHSSQTPLVRANAPFTSTETADPQITAEKAGVQEGPAVWKSSLTMAGKVEAAMGLFSLATLHHLEITLSRRGFF